jgi:hypothetical protein
MASRNKLRPVHVLAAAVAAALFLFWLAVHVVAYREPAMPLNELYAVYLPFEHLTLFVICVA